MGYDTRAVVMACAVVIAAAMTYSYALGRAHESALTIDAFARADYYRVLLDETLTQAERAHEACIADHAHLSQLLGYDLDPRWPQEVDR